MTAIKEVMLDMEISVINQHTEHMLIGLFMRMRMWGHFSM